MPAQSYAVAGGQLAALEKAQNDHRKKEVTTMVTVKILLWIAVIMAAWWGLYQLMFA